MHSRKLNSQLQRLVYLISKTSEACGGDLELQGHWGRYLCVLVAGYLENAIGEIYTEFAGRAGTKPVASFVSARVLKIRNPKAQTFVETAGAFKAEWAVDLTSFLDQGGRKDAIDAIMNNRNLIAHGESVGISIVRVKDYLEKSNQVIEFLEGQCGFNASYG